MKIQLIFSRNSKGYNRSLQDEEDHSRCNDPARENQGIEDGRPLTLILFFALLLCCGTWTWTVWYASQTSGDVKNLGQPIKKSKYLTLSDNNFQGDLSKSNADQCTLIPKDLRYRIVDILFTVDIFCKNGIFLIFLDLIVTQKTM